MILLFLISTMAWSKLPPCHSQMNSLECKIFKFTNRYRVNKGLKALPFSPGCFLTARWHAKNMRACHDAECPRGSQKNKWCNRLHHVLPRSCPKGGGEAFRTRLKRYTGSTGGAENLITTHRWICKAREDSEDCLAGTGRGEFSNESARSLVKRWINSPGHRKNMLKSSKDLRKKDYDRRGRLRITTKLGVHSLAVASHRGYIVQCFSAVRPNGTP